MKLDYEYLFESIRECRECNITENSIYITTHTGTGPKIIVHWACHDDLNRIKYYFLHSFIVHATLLQNLYSTREIIRLAFIKSFYEDVILEDANEEELKFAEVYKSVLSAQNYLELQEEIKMTCEFMQGIGYGVNAFLFNDRKQALEECLQMERKYNVTVKFTKTILDYENNINN